MNVVMFVFLSKPWTTAREPSCETPTSEVRAATSAVWVFNPVGRSYHVIVPPALLTSSWPAKTPAGSVHLIVPARRSTTLTEPPIPVGRTARSPSPIGVPLEAQLRGLQPAAGAAAGKRPASAMPISTRRFTTINTVLGPREVRSAYGPRGISPA
jgi:hypothetical protein